MKQSIAFIIILFLSLSALGQGGSVSNSHVVPRFDGSGLFDVYYDLSGNDGLYYIQIEVSFDDGNTFTPVPTTYLSGHISNLSPGIEKHIVWDGLGSFPNQYSAQARIKITVLDGSGDWPRDTETQVVDVVNPATGKTWMDRNLGASRAATSSTDEESYGDLYQWGRAADGHQKRNSGTTSTLSSTDQPGHGNFILSNSDATWDWRSPQNDNLWQGVNGVNNPCPRGFRLPTEAELTAERLSWSSNNSGGAFASPLKLPVAGFRYDGIGSLGSVGSYGSYWSGTVDGAYSRLLDFSSTGARMFNYRRASGFSVRCFKD